MALQSSYQFEAIGTLWAIETNTPLIEAERRYIHKIVDDFDQAYSRFRDDSLVSRARSDAPGLFIFPDSITPLYDMYARLEEITDGAVSPLVGETLERLGYDAQYSLKPVNDVSVRPTPFTETIKRSGSELSYSQSALLDIGAIGKGYLVDVIAHFISQNHSQYVVDGGGDMAIATSKPYVVGLEHPLDVSKVIGTVSLQNQSICGSSTNRRNWGKGLHHIIDARTGRPTQNDIIATWAIAGSTMLADALATALFFVPASELRQYFGDFQHVIMWSDLRVEHAIRKE